MAEFALILAVLLILGVLGFFGLIVYLALALVRLVLRVTFAVLRLPFSSRRNPNPARCCPRPTCGQINPSEARFCRRCGRALSYASSPAAGASRLPRSAWHDQVAPLAGRAPSGTFHR